MSHSNFATLAGATAEGQMLATRLLDRLEHQCGTGEQIEHAIREIVGPLILTAGAKLRAFFRAIQKAVERAGATT